MSEFAASANNLLESLRASAPPGLKRLLRRQAAAVALWGATSRRLRMGAAPGPRLRHGVYRDLLEELTRLGDEPAIVKPLFARWEREGRLLGRYEALSALVDEHPRPHRANLALALHEMANRIDEVRSLPWSVMMDLTSVCNIQCNFCKYEHNHVPKVFLPVEHVKQIEWFRYITTLNFSAGTAESIIHPAFNEIFDHVRDAYPHLFLHILTNGRGLTEAKLERFRDRLDWLYVSMNASNREDYDRAIHKGDWDAFSANMRHMKRILAGAARPFVQANFVMMRWNLDRAVEYLEFAAEHGARRVSFAHYYPHYNPDLHRDNPAALGRKFAFEDSLYNDKQRSDEVFARVAARAAELGLEVQVPPPFSSRSKVYFGLRTLGDVPGDCQEPWGECFLLWGWKSRREEATICCGLASDIGAFFDRDEIRTLEGFRRFWNQPVLRAYRRTVNGERVNPICALCRKVDRFDPDSIYPDQRDFYRFNGLPVPEHLDRYEPAGRASPKTEPVA